MKSVLRILFTVVCTGMFVLSMPALSGDDDKDDSPAAKRAEIDTIAKETLDDLFAKSEKAKDLSKKAYGWAVFDNTRVTFIFTGGGGAGVAVEKPSGKRTYMKMGSGGLAFGIGAQKYQVVFLFETKDVFTNFVEKGWKAEAGANAAAGTKGANVGTQFINGIATYQITESGLMASADISGTKYSKYKKLNEE